MSNLSNIVLADAQSTPVDHTFVPALQGLEGRDSVAEYEDRDVNSGTPVGFYRIHTRLSRPTANRKTYRATIKVSTPVLETLSNSTVSGILPAPTVGYTPLCEMTFVLPERANLQVRKDLRKFVANLLANTQIVGIVENLDAPM